MFQFLDNSVKSCFDSLKPHIICPGGYLRRYPDANIGGACDIAPVSFEKAAALVSVCL